MPKNVKLKSKTGAISSPPVECQEFPAPLVLLSQVLRYTTPDLGKSATHDPAEVALGDELALIRSTCGQGLLRGFLT